MMPSRTKSALIGGLVTAVVATLFALLARSGGIAGMMVLSCLNCFVYLVAGLIAVWHYTNEHSLTLTGGQGVMLGLLAGIIAGVAAPLLQYILTMVGIVPDPTEVALEMMSSMGTMDSSEMETMAEMMEGFGGPFLILFNVVWGAILGGVLGLAGGAIGSTIWNKGKGGDEEAA